MARKKLKQPSDIKTSNERKKIKERPHFDFDCDVFAEEHYHSYLIVKNTSKEDKGRKHNRFYLDSDKELEFLLKTGYGSTSLTSKNHKSTGFHILSKYPKQVEFIQALISKIKRNSTRAFTQSLVSGIGVMIDIFKEAKEKIPDDPCELSADIHQKYLFDAILDGKIKIVAHRIHLAKAWSHIRSTYKNSAFGILPSQPSVETQMEELFVEPGEEGSSFKDEEEKDEITLEILFQLDYYSQIELELTISRVKEYQKWIKELESYGDLFRKANLLKTYYGNTSRYELKNLYILLYEEDPVCWIIGKKKIVTINGKKQYSKVYSSESEKERHQDLKAIAETGIDISVRDVKMFAWWHKTLYPEWPFVKVVTKPYDKFFGKGQGWYKNNISKSGESIMDFSQRILPNGHTLYPMYLRLLIDSSANLDVASSSEVHKKDDGTYGMGVVHHHLRMLDSVKIRSNTVPPSHIIKGTFTDECVNFFTEWLRPIYERSSSKAFFQYFGNKSTIMHLEPKTVIELKSEKKKLKENRSFFEKYEIYKSVEEEMGNEVIWEKERVYWIKHKNIRAANNFADYKRRYGEWQRAHVKLGHQGDQTEKLNYQKFSWKLGEDHQIATTLLHIQQFCEGKVVDEKLENVFKQPHCDCLDNANPTYPGAPTINDGEVCTAWRKCAECEHSKVFPWHHGPTIMAWRILMDQERERSLNTEEWVKEFGMDHEAAISMLRVFKPEAMEFAELKAAERMPFVRLMMMQTKLKRKKNHIREEPVNG